MDREPEELQFLGVCGIFSEAYKIILSWKKIFSQITLALILPLSFIILTHEHVSQFLSGKIIHNEVALQNTWSNDPRYKKITNHLSSEWTAYWLFKAAYILFTVVFSLLSTSACVYTIACIYTAKDITFKKVISVVPKVWKRLMITFLCNFVIIMAFGIIFAILLVLWAFLIGPSVVGIIILGSLLIITLIGFGFITILYNLACVVSVLEDVYGIQALIKSKKLMKGKMWVASAIFVIFQIFGSINHFGIFEKLVEHGESLGMVNRVSFGIVCWLFLSILLLLSHIVQTILYFVCKSYHNESINKSCLADHLEVYLGEYTPLKSKDVQLEQFDV